MTRPIQHADELRSIFRNENKRIFNWFAAHGRDVGMTTTMHKSTISNALAGAPVTDEIAAAFAGLYDHVRANLRDFLPPRAVDAMTDFASMGWWRDVLRPDVPADRWARVPGAPLTGKMRANVQALLDDYHERLECAVAAFEADCALVDAFKAEDAPEYQRWVQSSHGWTLSGLGTPHRVGKSTLRAASDDLKRRALALHDKHLSLPDLMDPQPLQVATDVDLAGYPVDAGPIEPWNGQEFDGYRDWVDDEREWAVKKYRAKVVFFWNGERYDMREVERYWRDAQGFEIPEDMRLTLKTGVKLTAVRDVEPLESSIEASLAWQVAQPTEITRDGGGVRVPIRPIIERQYGEFPSRQYAIDQHALEVEAQREAQAAREAQLESIRALMPGYTRSERPY